MMTDKNNYTLKETDSNLCETEEDKRLNIEIDSKKEFINDINNIKKNGNRSSEKETEITEEQKMGSEDNFKTKLIQNVPLGNSDNYKEKENYSGNKNQQNPILNYFKTNLEYLKDNEKEPQPQSDIQLNNSRNSISKEEEYSEISSESNDINNNSSNDLMNPISNDSHIYISATLFDVIRFQENKRIALYKELNGTRIYVYEYTIGRDSNVDWFFPNRFEAQFYIYDYFRQKYALNPNNY